MRDEHPLLPTFKKKTGRKPIYPSRKEGKRIVNQKYLDGLRSKGIRRLELKVASDLEALLESTAAAKGMKKQDVALDILKKVLTGQTVSLEDILASEPQTEIAPTSST